MKVLTMGVLVAVLLTARTAGSDEAVNEFSGHCHVVGTYQFGEPEGDIVPFTFEGAGTCIGSLNGAPPAEHPKTVSAEGSFQKVADVPMIGEAVATLTFASGETIDFTVEGYLAVNIVTGDAGGHAYDLEQDITEEQPEDPSQLTVAIESVVVGLRG